MAQVRAGMQGAMLPDYPVPSLLELAAIVERAQLYVGNDAGPRHFAVAAGIPTVGIFGRPRPENWTPPDDARHRAVAYDPGCKSACTYPQCGLECIQGVSLEAVQGEIESLIGEGKHDGGHRR